jgi:hypothetical protein
LEHINWQRQLSKMSNTGNDNYLIFIFEFFFTCLPIRKTKPKRNLQKFHNIHSNSSTSPSHRHEGFGEICENFTTVTVTVPLVLPTGMKDSKGKSNVSTWVFRKQARKGLRSLLSYILRAIDNRSSVLHSDLNSLDTETMRNKQNTSMLQ